MGRHAEGWKLRTAKNGFLYVRFRHAGRRYEFATGTRDPGEAAREAQQIYARSVGGESVRSVQSLPFDEVGAAWLATVVPDLKSPDTVTLYEAYISRLCEFFVTIGSVTGNRAEDYRVARLGQVTGDTCRRELMVLERICRYAKKRGHLTEVPEIDLPKKSAGKRVKSARKTDFLVFTDRELDRIVAALPVWSKPGRGKATPVRARFLLARELGLRPATLDKLSVPEHYRPGGAQIRITADIDKTGYARTLPLSDATRKALDDVSPQNPPVGLLFGAHDYRYALRAAAAQIGIADGRQELISDYDFRHSTATNLAQLPEATVSGTMFVLGHRNPATTARYLEPAQGAAVSLLRAATKARNKRYGRISGDRKVSASTGRRGHDPKKANDSK